MDAKLAVSSYKAVKKKERSANNLQYSRGTLRLNLLIIALFAIAIFSLLDPWKKPTLSNLLTFIFRVLAALIERFANVGSSSWCLPDFTSANSSWCLLEHSKKKNVASRKRHPIKRLRAPFSNSSFFIFLTLAFFISTIGNIKLR